MLAGRPEARHARLVAGLVLGVLLLHAGLLGSIDLAGSLRPATPAAAMQVRHIVPPERPPAAAALPVEPPAALPRPRPVAPPRPALPAMATTAAAVPPAGPAPGLEPPASVWPAVAAAQGERASAPVGEAAQAVPPAAEGEWPVYATRMPPPASLRYALQRGRLSGRGELQWQPGAGRYTLRFDSSIVGVNVLAQTSQGVFDTAGIAPERFTDRRARRPLQAANFQREAGKVSFSGPAIELPLVPGVQDRLSWMIQLAAVVAAEPARWGPGARITLQVVGARGDAAVWVFRCLGLEPLALAAGPIETLRFLREPRGPYDTTVEVWLDPARHHLPVRASMRGAAEGDALDLRLSELVLGP